MTEERDRSAAVPTGIDRAPAGPFGTPITSFEINVSKETFKFNAAHFVAYPGFRERLHGHNYQISLRLLGARTICNDGYLLDFGDVKKVVKDVCRDLNEFFLCPTLSDVMQISVIEGGHDETGVRRRDTVKLVCEDGATFLFPRSDCVMLPIVHATTEELAVYLWGRILTRLDVGYLRKRGIHTMEVTCAEAPGQDALFRMELPRLDDGRDGGGDGGMEGEIAKRSDVRRYISSGDLFPRPCLPKAAESGGTHGAAHVISSSRNVLQNVAAIAEDESAGVKDTRINDSCCSSCRESFSKQLQELIDTMKDNQMMGDCAQKLHDNISKQP